MPQQQFHPISKLPLFTEMIDGMLAATREQHREFSIVLSTPHVLDDETVDRALRVYNEQGEYLDLYDNQLNRWRQQNLTAGQRREIERLTAQLPVIRKLTQEILEMLAEIRKGTIDRIMEKDDFELGLEWLLKMTENEPPPTNGNQ